MNKNVKRATLVLALTPLMAVPATAALATTTSGPVSAVSTVSAPAPASTTSDTTTTTTHTDAPPASASAVAAKVDGIISVGETAATAGNGSGTAHAHALDLGGQTVSGGDVKDGKDGGNLFGTGDTPLGDIELAPWSGSVGHDNGGTQAQAEAALAHAGLLGVLQLWLLHSQSLATWTSDASHGHSSSDAAEANLADQLDVKVLHAETDSNGKGSSAILVINGNGILTSDQTGNQCVIDADPLIKILCLQATGGKGADGSTTGSAVVAQATSPSGIPGITASGVTAGGGVAPQAPAAQPQNGPLPHTSGPSTPTKSRSLPFTGDQTALAAALGALLTAMGSWIMTVARRRRVGAIA